MNVFDTLNCRCVMITNIETDDERFKRVIEKDINTLNAVIARGKR